MIQSLSNRVSYPSLEKHVYLNQASLGLISNITIKKMNNFLHDVARHGNIHMSDQDELDLLQSMRIDASHLFHCEPRQIAVLASASEMLSQIPYVLKPKAKSSILMVQSDFPAVTRPWLKYAQDNDCQILFVKETKENDLTDQILREIKENISVIQVSLVQFSSGTKIDIKRLGKETKRFGIKLIVDITQAAGALPIMGKDWDADILITSGYKWLGGHGGVGLAYISDEILDYPPFTVGWMSAPNPFAMNSTECAFELDARSYTQSTMSYISIVGLQNSVREIIRLEPNQIERHAKSLFNLLLDGLRGTKWKPKLNQIETCNSPHIVSIENSIDDLDESLQKLKKNGIICSSRSGRIRISLAHYNNQNDVVHLIESLS